MTHVSVPDAPTGVLRIGLTGESVRASPPSEKYGLEKATT